MGALIGRGLCGDLMNGGGGWGLSDWEGGDGWEMYLELRYAFLAMCVFLAWIRVIR